MPVAARLLALFRSGAGIPEEVTAAAAPYRVASPFADARRVRNLQRYLEPHGKAERVPGLLLGLNPGLHGQMQTGIPFTDNARLAWYAGWVRGLEPSAHRRIEQSSRLLYSCFDEAAGGRPERLHAGLLLANAFPYVLLEPGREAHPSEAIEKLIEGREALRACALAWVAGIAAAARPERVLALGAFAEAIARGTPALARAPIERLPHPRALLYEKADGPRPRRQELIEGLRRAVGAPGPSRGAGDRGA